MSTTRPTVREEFENAFKEETIGIEGHAEGLWGAKWAIERCAKEFKQYGNFAINAEEATKVIIQLAKELES